MLGNYRSIAKLGQGGMAEVRLALAQRAGGFNKLLVLKLLREDLCTDEEFLTMFLAEARVAALLNHRNIVQTNEVGFEDGRHFIAMEYLEGQTLSGVIGRVRRDKFPLELAVFIFAQVLHGLHYAHELTDLDGTALHVIHRDVSPQNIFVTYSGQVKLLDFGIAKIASANAPTKNGIIKGKAGYMAPEQAGLPTGLDRRADVFSVGVMLWEAIAKRRFVPSDASELVILQRRISNEDTKLADVAPDADPMLAEICNKSVAYERDDRWPDAQSFAEALEGWLKRPKDVLEKELGRLMTESFAEDRARIRRVIEDESAKPAREETTPVALRELTSGSDRTPHSRTSGGRSSPNKRRDPDAVTGIATSATLVLPSKRALRPWHVVALAGAACVVGGAMFAAFPAHRSLEAAVAPVPTTPKPPPVVEGVLHVRSQPDNVTFTIDDGPPQQTPYRGSFVRDERQHRLKFSAEGYEPDARDVAFAADIDLEVALRRTPTPAATTSTVAVLPQPRVAIAPQPQPTTRPQPTASETSDGPGHRPPPRHGIDENDPYHVPTP